MVALLAEDVDRNVLVAVCCRVSRVALLAEGVDRNNIQNVMAEMNAESPSSRRAWIEINIVANGLNLASRRPPRGGRG